MSQLWLNSLGRNQKVAACAGPCLLSHRKTCFFCYCACDRVPCSLGWPGTPDSPFSTTQILVLYSCTLFSWPGTHFVAQADLELEAVLLPQPPESWTTMPSNSFL